MNARSEIYNKLAASETLASECSVIFDAKTGVLAENWDWAQDLKDQFLLLRYHFLGNHRVLTLTEYGILAKIGMNSQGMGLGLNALFGSEHQIATPIHAMCYELMKTPDFDRRG